MMKGKKDVECYRMVVLQRSYILGTVISWASEEPVSMQDQLK